MAIPRFRRQRVDAKQPIAGLTGVNGVNLVEAAALADYTLALFNLNEFIYIP